MPEMAHPDGRPQNPTVHHEPTDVNLRWLLILGGIVLVLAVIIHAVVLWGLLDYRDYEDRVKESTFPLATGKQESLPPEPRLEPLDRTERIETSNVGHRRAVSETILNSYGATSEKGYVRIPIDRAMKLLEDKLPARHGRSGPRKKQDGLAEGGRSNSGRLFRGRGR